MSVLHQAQVIAEELIDIRRRVHQRPEIGLRLPHTQQVVLDELADLDIQIETGIELSSVIAVVRGTAPVKDDQPRPSILLRAEMDALPVHEDHPSEFRSGVPGIMHACGHDLHLAMLIGAVRILAQNTDQLHGDVVAIFQPGEEGFDGAQRMLDEGLLEITGTPVQAAFAIHVLSNYAHAGSVFSRPGALMSSSDGVVVTVKGRAAHSSAPHLGRDPIQAACEMVLSLQTNISRQIDAFTPVTFSVGKFHGGNRRNMVPETVEFEANVRTTDRDVRYQVTDLIERVCHGVADTHDVNVNVRFAEEYPVTMNDTSLTEFCLALAGEIVGADNVRVLDQPMTTTEDFAHIAAQVPSTMLLLGAALPDRDPDAAPANHSPHAAYDESVLPLGAALYAEFALRKAAEIYTTGDNVVPLQHNRPQQGDTAANR